jgi:hypothetical protein
MMNNDLMFGACECGYRYEVSDRDDHCGECGTCWTHCANGGDRHYFDEAVTA